LPTSFGRPGRWPQGSGAVAVVGAPGEAAKARRALLDFAMNGLKADLFKDLMEMMG
jgi:hypothetical protein